MKTYKRILFLTITVFLHFSFAYCIFGHVDDKINYIEMKIEEKENGSAIITENWDVNSMERFSYYKLYKSINENEITNFSVEDEKGIVYENVGIWDIYMPNEEKINRCGINKTDEGIELCWGVEDNGFHAYKISYEIKNFNEKTFDFIDGSLNPVPADIELTIVSNNGNNIKELSNEDIKKELERINNLAIKPQDVLVFTIISILSVVYLFVDIYRYINTYQERRERLCTWQTH